MKTVTIDELIKSKKCLDTLHDAVRYELNDSIYTDTFDEEMNVLTLAIVQIFYAWLRQNNINIEADNIQE